MLRLVRAGISKWALELGEVASQVYANLTGRAERLLQHLAGSGIPGRTESRPQKVGLKSCHLRHISINKTELFDQPQGSHIRTRQTSLYLASTLSRMLSSQTLTHSVTGQSIVEVSRSYSKLSKFFDNTGHEAPGIFQKVNMSIK